MSTEIDSFRGQYRFLSNFYPVNTGVLYEHVRFPTVEHAYQAAKAFLASPRHDRVILNAYASLPKASMAKALGQVVSMGAISDTIRLSVMKSLLSQKFEEPVLRKLLLDTGTKVLVEGNTWNDTFWGVCDGKGKNNLGRLLMWVRSEISWSVLHS